MIFDKDEIQLLDRDPEVPVENYDRRDEEEGGMT
jgi:hypothetical protein